VLIMTSCANRVDKVGSILIKNPLGMDRSYETVEIDLTAVGLDMNNSYTILDVETGKKLISQEVDTDGDGISNQLLFQPEVKAHSEKIFHIVLSDKKEEQDSVLLCYSRFVPERTDDYAWENNRVAFRTYGPTAQRMVEDGVSGGTLTSGIDAWLKRVEYPIINAWYHKETETEGTYHEDSGEGLDNFHVGASRGVGGVAVKVDSSYYFSKNFISWKRLYNGPIRTSFVLKYEDWDAQGKTISEEKHISLDYGSNLSRFEVWIQGTDTLAVGLALHEKNGKVSAIPEEGWASYWEPHDDSELGTGIVSPKGFMLGYDEYITEETDLSNLYTYIKTEEGKAIYYAGFGWKKSEQFKTAREWETYLKSFARLGTDSSITVSNSMNSLTRSQECLLVLVLRILVIPRD